MDRLNTPGSREPLALVGIGCRYPGGVRSPSEFWQFLTGGGDGFIDVPADRWDAERFTDDDGSVQGRARPRQAAFLTDVSLEEFDAQFFGLSPREGESMDPQQRLLLEVAWEAFEDAGIPVAAWEKGRVGVYVGGFTVDNYIIQTGILNRYQVNQFTGTSSTLGMLSNRLSYVFDLKGPSLTIDTACSSSLVAFHYACQDLWNGRTDAALVGGANVLLYPTVPVAMSKGGFLSPDSRSKAFDVTADGYSRGEGAGMVILRPLSQALANGDRIYALVHGAGVNQDGRTAGIASPSGTSQAELIRSVLDESGKSADDVVLIEAHGTGTAIGDPTEVTALAQTLGGRTGGGVRYVGSVKGNIGHQEAGAGVAGVIKAALCLYHGEAAPQANLGDIDPGLPLGEAGMEVPRATMPLPTVHGSALACINSFGFGGSNAHAVLGHFGGPESEAPVQAVAHGCEATDTPESPTLLLLSAKVEGALRQRAVDLREALSAVDTPGHMADVAHTLACHRDFLSHRAAVVALDRDTARDALDALAQGRSHPALVTSDMPASDRDPVFVYTGMGPQWWGMGRELHASEPVFREAVEAADAAFLRHSGWSLLEEMLKDEASSRMARNEVAQPANFVLQHGLTELLRHWGIAPSAIVGHSVGEVGAVLAAGSLTLDDAALVAFHRSRLQQTRAGQGRMLATGLDLDTAKELAELYAGQISVAAVNSHISTVLAGDVATLTEVAAELEGQGIFNKLLFGEVAYHSHQMDGLEAELLECLAALAPSAPELELFSSVLGCRVQDAIHDSDYWWGNVRKPALFHDALQALVADGYRTFVEIGPHPALSGAIEQAFARAGQPVAVHASLVRQAGERESLLRTAGSLWCGGRSGRWDDLLPGRRTELPAYPWQRQHLWRESRASIMARRGKREHPYLGLRTPDPLPSWETSLGSAELSSLRDHVVDGRPVFPAAAYVETFLAAVESLHPQAGFGISDVRFESLLALGETGTIALRTTSAGDELTLHARNLANDEEWRPYARARLVRQSRDSVGMLTSTDGTADVSYTGDEVYSLLAGMGLDYRGSFRTIESARVSGNRVHGMLRLPEGYAAPPGLRCPPALVDGGLQLLALACADADAPPVPVSVDRVAWFKTPLAGTIRVEGEFDGSEVGRIAFLDEEGSPLLELQGVRMQRIPRAHADLAGVGIPYHVLQWKPFHVDGPGEDGAAPGVELLTFGDDATGLTQLADALVGAGDDASGHTLGVFMSAGGVEPDAQAAMALVQAVRELEARGKGSRLVLVTRGAWRVTPTDTGMPGSAVLWGMARTLRREKPKLGVTCVDIDGSPESLVHLGAELAHLPRSGELAIRDGQVYSREVAGTSTGAESLDEVPISVPVEASVALEIPSRPNVNGLRYRVQPRREPVGDEVEVRFEAASLNFKDVLKAMGRIAEQSVRDTFFQGSLGMETAGTVVRVGPTSDFEVGERVIAGLRSGSICSYGTFLPEDAFLLRWGDLPLSAAESAILPISFITAHYGLLHLGRLGQGECVLLHSATGGVGHAAIQVARATGARILATAGTEEKRTYLESMGVEAVFDSRSLDFEDRVLEATDGRGVDVVLNFLPGALLHASLRVLAPFGRLVEIGKADIGANKGLPLADFERNLTFAALDIDQMLSIRRELFYAVAHEVKDRFDSGDYQTLPFESRPADDVVEVFRELAEGNHIGKRVLELSPGPTCALPLRVDGAAVRADATYVVTGGHGGFGLETAKWLAVQGATHILVLSRSAQESPSLDALRTKLTASGGTLWSRACDVGNAEALDAVLDDVAAAAPPIRGMFHSAAVLADAPVDLQTEEKFQAAFHAKAHGALNLHRSSIRLRLPLDHFVLFSSVSGMLGNAGQANYAAANVYLDALAEHRRAQGLPATSIAWGAIAEAGMVARDEAIAQHLAAKGIQALPLVRAFRCLGEILAGAPPAVGAFDVQWDRWGDTVVLDDHDPAASMVDLHRSGAGPGSFDERFTEADPGDRLVVTQDFLRETVGRLLNLDQEKVSLETPLLEMGVDSLMSVDLELALEAGLGGGSPLVQLNIQENLAGLSTRVVQRMSEVPEVATAEAELDVGALSDSEVDTLLKELMDDPASPAGD